MKSVLNSKIFLVTAFAVAFAFVESSVVVYLRALYYPEGFAFPLKAFPADHLLVELAREFSTLAMLVAAGMLAGKNGWERFSFFLIAFGMWDIFYYVWLKLILDWPASWLDWDILFLIPIPWIGPVIVPVLISAFLIIGGILILRKEEGGFHPSLLSWALVIAGSGLILYSFMSDTPATLRLQVPQPYRYELFLAGFGMYIAALYFSLTRKTRLRRLRQPA